MSELTFRKPQALSLRLWHWLNAFVILSLLVTVLLRKTLLSWRTNAELIEVKLSDVGTTITPELAKEIAVAIRNPLWDWHVYLGFALTLLLASRLLIAIFVEKKKFNTQVFRNIFNIKSLKPNEKFKALHFNLVKVGYLVFYLVTLLMVISGLTLNFKTDLNIAKELAGTIKEVHEYLMWFFVVFVFGHIVGVIVAESGSDRGIVSDMINGGDQQK